VADDFFDSNVVIYLTSGDKAKASRAQELLEKGGIISVQVLNEAVSVFRTKNRLGWGDIDAVIEAVRDSCEISPLTEETHDLARDIARHSGFNIYDACIVAAAKLAGCKTVWTEDMHDGQLIEGVRIRNPF
jgi:predicted nucleic acid-binding protein